MEERNLGRSGLRVSLVGLGTNNFGLRGNGYGRTFDLEATRAIIYRALDLGVTLIDTADIYGKRGGSEEVIGMILGERRKDVVIATKFVSPMDDAGKLRGASRRYVITAVEASLKRLRTDWIDLYQMHRPDPETPIEETARALDDLVRAGKVRYLGLSNFAPWQIVEAQMTARQAGLSPFVSSQDEYSLLARRLEHEAMPVQQRYGLGLLPFFPLAGGFLSGKYKRNAAKPEGARLTISERAATRNMTDGKWEAVEKLADLGAKGGHSLLEIAFAWLASRKPVASIIAGATSPEQIEANVKASETTLTPEELSEIDEITAPFR